MKNFEKHLHDHFDGRKVNVDKNELWANIAPQLDPPKKDRKKSWFFFFLGLAAGATLLGLYLTTQPKEEPIVLETVNTELVEQGEIAPSTQNAIVNQTTNRIPAEPQKTEATTIAIPNSTTKETNYINPNNIVNTSPTNNSVQIKTNSHNTRSTNTATVQEANKSIFQTSTKSTVTNKDQVIPFAETFQKEATTKVLESNLLNISSLSLNQFTITGIDLDKLPTALEKQQEDFITPSKSKLRYGIGFHAGISKTQNMLRENSSSEFLYTQLRASTEDQLQTLHLGLSAVVEIKRNIYVQAGLEYSRIGSKLNIDDELILIDTTQEIIIRHGNFTDTIGAGDRYIIQEFSKNNHRNSFHLIDLPILFGYQFGKTRWRGGIEAGAYINLRLQKEGQIIQEDLSIYDIEKDQNNWYKTNVGIRPHLGLVSTYDLSSNYQLYFRTGITFNKIFSTNNSPITVEKSMFGIQLGGRYYF